jgi:predicted metal-binding membrane protein
VSTPQRLRLTLAVLLVGLPLACWIWVVAMARDMYGPMTGASAWMMTATWDGPRLLLLWAMWAAMMAGMMLPSAAPIVLLYARSARNAASPRHASERVYAMVAGYVLVWAAFSVGATVLQRMLAEWLLLTPMMEPATTTAAAALLLVAGVYQLTPLKLACLQSCRSPIAFLIYCLGCCWALMLLLLAGGVMNLVVILALTVWVAVEKLAPFGEQSARVSGALLLLTGVWLLVYGA